MIEEIPDVKTDAQKRIIDKQGRPLRFKKKGQLPFHGNEGKPHPRQKHLEERQKAFDDLREKQGRKRPGSYKK